MKTPGDKKGYALDFVSVARYVATEIDRASPGALSVSDLAMNYTHNPGDLHRVRTHEHFDTDREAITFLIREAISALDSQLESDGNGGLRLAVPAEELRFGRKRLHLNPPPLVLRDAFSEVSGEFHKNIRLPGRDDLGELRESMRAWGWIPEFPAIKDERGTIIVGHRRIAVAEELGIQPFVKTIDCGRGDAGDAKRFKYALASNIGFKPMTPTERGRIAEYLYKDREWSMERIGEALNVDQRTISRDLDTVSKTTKRGRPRKATDEQISTAIHAHFEEGLTRDQAAAAAGVSITTMNTIRNQEIGRREALAVPMIDGSHKCPECGHVHPRQLED